MARRPGSAAGATVATLGICLSLALSLGACAGEGSPREAVDDPFGALAGKADGTGGFFDRDRRWQVDLVTAGGDRDDVEVTITGPDTDATIEGASLRDWAREAGDGPRGTHRLRLPRRKRIAGMRSFLLRPVATEAATAAALDRGLLYAALGIAAPRMVRATVSLDGVDLGEHLFAEHVGDTFIDDHFDTSDGDVARGAESDWSDLLADRLANDEATPWHFSSVMDLPATAAALAVAAATGETAALSFYDPCEASPRPCLVPIPEAGASVVDLGALEERLLSQTQTRRAWTEALTTLADCFADDDCGEDAATVTRIGALLGRENTADAPTGTTDYAAFTWADEDLYEFAFRNLEGGHAVAVTAHVTPDSTGAPYPVGLEYDRDEDLWTGALSIDEPFSYEFEVTRLDGSTERRRDPTRPGSSSRLSRLDPADVDVLYEVDRLELDVREPSGLAMYQGRLFVVGDEGDDLIEIDPATGQALSEVDLDVRGIEGIAIDPVLGEIYVADEDRGVLLRFSPEGEELGSLFFDWTEDAGGIEGLTMRASDGHLFFAKERSPARIAEVTPQEELLRRPRIEWARDLSALAHSTDDGRLYAVSDQDQRLYRLDDDFEVSMSWDLGVEKPEGLVIRGGRVYVVSDETAELVVYEMNRR